jgi:ABC-type multidrug transport system fused ATPase/permease subunit
MAGRTVVMVAHRPSLLALADRVMELQSVVAREPLIEPNLEMAPVVSR